MDDPYRFRLNPGWRILFRDMGLPVGDVLERAGLSATLFDRLPAMLGAEDYFALWRAMDAASGGDELPMLMTRALNVEVLSPPLFAAVCSLNLRQAARRVAAHKVLTGPIIIELSDTPSTLTLIWKWPIDINPPLPLLLSEVLFWVFVARTCTRLDIKPRTVTMPQLPEVSSVYEEYFGAPIRTGRDVAIGFNGFDADLPFLTANDAIWSAFEPELRKQLVSHSANTTITDRARAVLLRAIPAACTTADHVAAELSLTPRTLQRRLREEGASFKTLLNDTRASMARHYLANSVLPLAEISFLLGYKDPGSFNRAFRGWTGTTPDRYRQQSAHVA